MVYKEMAKVVLTKNKIRKTAGDRVLDIFVYGFVLLYSLAIILPFWTQLMESFSSSYGHIGFKLIPNGFTLEPYLSVFKQKTVGTAYLNTLFRTSIGVILSVIVTFGAAYPLSKKNLPFNKTMTTIVIITMFFYGGLIPEYFMIDSLGLMDNRWVLILPYIVSGFNIMIMRNFMFSIPKELEESAFIDGANEIVIAFRIILPVSKPIIATVALYSAVQHWNDWFKPMLFIRTPQKQVMMVLLRRILLESQISAMFDDPTNLVVMTEDSVRAATMFVAIIPILLVYPIAQKYFVTGLMTGAVKG